MKKLIPMTQYILNIIGIESYLIKKIIPGVNIRQLRMINDYAIFLTQPLELWMFVPCDDKGNILKHPIKPLHTDTKPHKMLLDEWVKAKERVLFKGFKIVKNHIHQRLITTNDNKLTVFVYKKETDWYPSHGLKTIEDLIQYNLELNKEIL